MKKILLSTVAFAGLTAGAMAADLPARAAPPAPVMAVPVFTWTGFYVGVNGGVAFQDEDSRGGRRARGGRDGNDSSILGGGQVGYNMQFGSFVAGVEADLQAIDFERINTNLARGPRGPRANGNNNDEIDAFGTVRGRLGFAFDRAMIYATGGLAWKTDEGNNGGRRFGNNNDDENIGWTVGGGVEYAFTNSISAKVEGLYVDFSDGNNNRNRRLPRVNFTGNDSREFGLVRAGLNFRFNTF
ncbi:MAG TPA: outer membrane beta-barrel protein [Microvirga sp.]|jgi:outer membrane immunogenic protein|nr:outer membrane beta-barrel protein [Microvirga sp.]